MLCFTIISLKFSLNIVIIIVKILLTIIIIMMKRTLTGTETKVNLFGDIYKIFEIKSGVRQANGLSPVLINCILQKLIRVWEQNFKNWVSSIKSSEQTKTKGSQSSA